MSPQTLEVRLRFAPNRQLKVGKLALVEREVVFQYDESFLGMGLSISPIRLPLRPGVQVFNKTAGLELFGVFEDAMPDSWGRRIIEAHFQRTLGRSPGLMERLAYVGTRAMGALTFYPAEDIPALPSSELDIPRLAAQAWDFDLERVEDVLPELRRVAGTSGGARPKALLGLPDSTRLKHVLPGDDDLPEGYAHWIVKFNARSDARDAGPLEFAYAEMAKAAMAAVPEHRLLETSKGRFFAVRRFDRPGSNRRIHLHSIAGLLHADYRTPGTEYKELFRLTEALTRDCAQKGELFRRACLNVLACNRDDHLKNFAFLMDSAGVWRLAPHFDFNFHEGPNHWHTLSVAGEGQHPRRAHLLKLAAEVDLRERHARQIIEEVRSAVASFDKLAKNLDISKRTRLKVSTRLNELDS